MNKVEIIMFNIMMILASVISAIILALISIAFPFLLEQARAILIGFSIPLTLLTMVLIYKWKPKEIKK